MNVKIDRIRAATSDEWDAIWKDCEYATYFHSREWADIWQTYSNGKIYPIPQLITFSDGKECLLPISFEKRLLGFLKLTLSSPVGTFGGWISKDELLAKHAKLMTNYMTSHFRAVSWRMNPYDPNMPLTIDKPVRNDDTFALDLSGGFDLIFKKWTKGHRSAVNQARKSGITTIKARSLDDWLTYYKIYEDSLARWGDKASSSYAWRLFEDMFRRQSQDIFLWLALHDEMIVAGAFCFRAKNHVAYWHGAALSDYFKFRPVNLLLYDVIKEACDENYRWFDFNPSGGHEGVTSFKKSFGAKPLSCPSVVIIPSSAKIIMNAQGKIKGALRRMKKMFS